MTPDFVIWIGELLEDRTPTINGDGETSRDFCYIDNAIQANLLSAATKNTKALNQVFNVVADERTSLNKLFITIQEELGKYHKNIKNIKPVYAPFRPGDVRHSHADITKANALSGYNPAYNVERGMEETVSWFIDKIRERIKVT